jgi:3-hydroxybutyryl-CoA dehydrogenase
MDVTIIVVGAGIMGTGISRVLLSAGYRVVLTDVDGETLKRSEGKIFRGIDREIERGVLEVKDGLRMRGRLTTSMDALDFAGEADMVIEAVPEVLSLKKKVFSELSAATGENTVLATNTSQLSITDIASATPCPWRVVGMHWFNPADRMKLVEIVRGDGTSEETLKKTVGVAESAGKKVVVALDRQGFITTRVLTAFLLECYRVYEEGVASMEDIDEAVRLAFNHPMGPFELSDLIGLDTMLEAIRGLQEAFGDRFKPPVVLVDNVVKGRVGRKAGKGFYG